MWKSIKVFGIFLLISVLGLSCQHEKTKNTPQKAKYVFFFIGDGMGAAHVQLTEAYLQSMNSEDIGFQKLSLDTVPVEGLATTHCNNRLITGSAAAGTALATGQKTNVGRIAKSPDGTENYESIACKLQNEGFKIGIITTVSIDHATPAVFYANQDNRKYYYSIGLDLIKSGFDFFGGGGFIDPDSIPEENLYELARTNGYKIYREKTDLDQLPAEDNIMLVNPVLGNDAEMPYAIDRKTEGGYSLAEITRAGIKHIDNDKGFFMMVEGGKIDWASHENDAATIVQEVIDFDLAVQEALNFYMDHPDETLIVITADHETGGLSLGNALLGYNTDFSYLNNQKTSYYRASHLFESGKMTEEELRTAFGIDDMSDWEQSMINRSRIPQDNPDAHMDYGGYYPMLKTYNHIVNLRSGAGFTTWMHTATPVPVYAIGAGQELFKGKYDNTDIPKRIMQAVNVEF